MMKVIRYILMLFAYPRKLAEAVNRAVTPEELDEIVLTEVTRR